MAKKEIVIIRPSDAVRSLEQYNEKVFALVHQVNLALTHDLVKEPIAETLLDALKEVQKFYKEQ